MQFLCKSEFCDLFISSGDFEIFQVQSTSGGTFSLLIVMRDSDVRSTAGSAEVNRVRRVDVTGIDVSFLGDSVLGEVGAFVGSEVSNGQGQALFVVIEVVFFGKLEGDLLLLFLFFGLELVALRLIHFSDFGKFFGFVFLELFEFFIEGHFISAFAFLGIHV